MGSRGESESVAGLRQLTCDTTALVDALVDGVAIYDATGLLVGLNTAFNRLLDGADLVLLDASGAPLSAAELPQRRVLNGGTSPGVSPDVFIRIAGGALLFQG